MSDRYPDRPEGASDGKAFEQLCVQLHRELLGEEIGSPRSSSTTVAPAATSTPPRRTAPSSAAAPCNTAHRLTRSGARCCATAKGTQARRSAVRLDVLAGDGLWGRR
jgi:hypothetical protein